MYKGNGHFSNVTMYSILHHDYFKAFYTNLFVIIGDQLAGTPKDDDIEKVPGETAAGDEDYISIIIGALAALIVILTIIVIFVIVRHKRRQRLNRQSLKPVSDTVLNINLNNFQNNVNGKVSNGNVYNGVATEDDDHVKEINGKGN
jgi:hypothetical protein